MNPAKHTFLVAGSPMALVTTEHAQAPQGGQGGRGGAPGGAGSAGPRFRH